MSYHKTFNDWRDPELARYQDAGEDLTYLICILCNVVKEYKMNVKEIINIQSTSIGRSVEIRTSHFYEETGDLFKWGTQNIGKKDSDGSQGKKDGAKRQKC